MSAPTEAEATAMQASAEKTAAIIEHEADVDESVSDRPACFKSTLQEILFVFIATMAMAMGPFMTGFVTVISSFVGKDLNMTTAQETWLIASSSLVSGALLLVFGRVADLFGRKSMIVGSFFLFALFSLAAGFAKTGMSLDILNGVLGIFTASAVPPAVGTLGIIYEKPSKRKNAAFASFSGGNPVGFAAGMVFSGIAAQLFSWRACYWLLAMIYLVLTVCAFFAVPTDTTPKQTLGWATIKHLDPVGTLLTIGGVGMFSASLSVGPTAPNGWKTGYVLALLLVGLALLVAFVFWELSYSHPLMPMHIWRDKNFSLCMAILTMGFMAFPVATFFISLFYQTVWHLSALNSAVHLLPLAIMGVIVNVVAALILHRVSNKLLMLVGTLAYTVAFILLAMNLNSSSYWAFCFPASLLAVVGADLEFNVANLYVMQSLPVEQQGTAGGIFQMVIRLFMTVGYGVATAIYNAVSKNPNWGGYYKGHVETQPFSACFWLSVALSAASVVMVPFLTIGTQGGKEKVIEEDGTTYRQDKT